MRIWLEIRSAVQCQSFYIDLTQKGCVLTSKNKITNHHARHNEHEKHRENVWKREIANILSNGGYLGFLLAYRLFVDSVSIYFVHTKRLSNDIKSKTIETIKNKSFRARILSRWSPNGHHLLFVNLLPFLFNSFVWETKKWNLYQIYSKIRVFLSTRMRIGIHFNSWAIISLENGATREIKERHKRHTRETIKTVT